jgi:hypothetical protein
MPARLAACQSPQIALSSLPRLARRGAGILHLESAEIRRGGGAALFMWPEI